MKPRYLDAAAQHAAPGNHRDRWMISYVDVLTILLVFFIAAAAAKTSGEIPKPVEQPKIEIAKPTPVIPRSPLADAEAQLAAQGIDAHLRSRGLEISLPQAILFPPGDDHISKDAIPVVEQIAGVLSGLPNRVSLTGHADASPIHNQRFKNNWELSMARGLRLLEMLSGRYGISESRMTVSSDGANRPMESNETPEGRARNRRVEILILNEP